MADASKYIDVVKGSNVRDRCIDIMRKTNKTGIEHGFTLIEKGCCGMYMTETKTGDDGSIQLELSDETVATFHTHPTERYESVFSVTDIQSMLRSETKFSVVLFDEDGMVVADIFDSTKDVEFQFNQVPYMSNVREANKNLHIAKVVLGEL